MSEVTQTPESFEVQKSITKEELETLRGLQDRFNTLANQLGNLELQIADMNEARQSLFKKYDEHKQDSNNFVKGLETKYGKVSINIQTGEISNAK